MATRGKTMVMRLSRLLVTRHQSTLAAQLPGKVIEESTNARACTEEEWINAKPYSDIPGPKPWPLIGNVWRFIFGEFKGLNLAEVHEHIYNTYGSIANLTNIPGRSDILFVFKPTEFEKVYRNEGVWPIRMGLETFTYYRKKYSKRNKFVSTGLTTEEGKSWHDLRTKVNQPMLQPKTLKLYVKPIAEVSEEFVERMRLIRDNNLEMPDDFFNEMNKWSIEAVTHIAIDKRLGCLKESDPNSDAQRLIENVKIFFDTLYVLELKMSPWKMISTPTWRRFVASLDVISEIASKQIQEAHEKMKSKDNMEKRDLSLLERFFQQESGESVAFSMTLDLLTAGIDTTSSSAAVLLYNLAKHPDKQEKVFEEIKKLWPDPNMPITEEKMNNLRYLRACIKESMRIMPIIVGNMRRTVKDMVLEGYQIPQGTSVLMAHRLASLNDDNFPKANEFIPERWLVAKNSCPMDIPNAKEVHPFTFMPFGFGPRSCIGRRFASLEIEILTISILRAFRIEYNHPPLKQRWNIIAVPDSPLKFKCIDRQY